MTSGINASKKLILVGNPNVGKSVIFRLLTGNYVLVSNFPGTTVEVTRGRMQIGGTIYEVVDTPGINSLVPQSEDERVTCEILLREKPDVIVQVADAKNLRRTLLITSQLAEFGLPMVLVLNMMDELEERGLEIDARSLSALFAIPVVETIAIYSTGKRQLITAIQNAGFPNNPIKTLFSREKCFQAVDSLLPPALLSIEWMDEGNRDILGAVVETLGDSNLTQLKQWGEKFRADHHRNPAKNIAEIRNKLLDSWTESFKKKKQKRFTEKFNYFNKFYLALLIAGLLLFAWIEIGSLFRFPNPFSFLMQALAEHTNASAESGRSLLHSLLWSRNPAGRIEYGIIPEIIHFMLLIAPIVFPLGMLLSGSRNFANKIGMLARRPSTGVPILIVVLLLVYEFVGYTGAQTMVGLLEKVIFGQYLIPFLQRQLPSGFLSELLLGKFGLISMGVTYAIGIVLPVVGAFFIAFGLLEDSGYLPRMTILSDRIMRIMGLNGKAVLPMVLGFGCCTMATMSTRILSSRKERLIATFLLALGIPCSAQLGVILGIAAGFSLKAALIVIGVVASQLLIVGYLSSLFIRGRSSEFIFEIPPVRVPQLKNVFLKTGYRIQWYLKEAAPLFLLGTLVLFLMTKIQLFGTSLLAWTQKALAPVLTGILHLPADAAGIFVLGFLRRDYGAAGLYDMIRSGLLDGQQAVVSLIVITLFVPCLATFLMIIKEQGTKKALAMTAFIIPFAIAVGGVVSWILRTFNIQFH